jgi:hypothetical protein
MLPIKETPAGSLAGVSCNQLGGCLHKKATLSAPFAQHLIAEDDHHQKLAIMGSRDPAKLSPAGPIAAVGALSGEPPDREKGQEIVSDEGNVSCAAFSGLPATGS